MLISPLIDPFALYSVADDTSPKLGGDLDGQSHSLTDMTAGTFSGTITAAKLLPWASTSDIGSNGNEWDEIYGDSIFAKVEVGIGTIDPNCTFEVYGNHVSGMGLGHFKGDAGNHCYLSVESPQEGKQAGVIWREGGNPKWTWDYITASDYFRCYSYAYGESIIQLEDDGDVQLPSVYQRAIGATNHTLSIDNNGYIGEAPCGLEFKENIRPLDGCERILQLNPVRYDEKDGPAKDLMGLVAEEVFAVVPEALVYRRMPVRVKHVDDYMGTEIEVIDHYEETSEPFSVDYVKLIPALVGLIKLLDARIAALETA